MRVGLVAPPFLAVPPLKYGGTELFIALLAEGLKNSGVDVVVFANGESTVQVEKRWLTDDSLPRSRCLIASSINVIVGLLR